LKFFVKQNNKKKHEEKRSELSLWLQWQCDQKTSLHLNEEIKLKIWVKPRE